MTWLPLAAARSRGLRRAIMLFALLLAGVGVRAAPGAPGLHQAVLQGDAAAVRQLIESGADLDAKDAFGSTPLTIAATFGRADAARALIDAGANLAVGDAQGSTPLHLAALFGRTPIVRALLARGAERDARNAAGHTPLDMVAVPLADMKDILDALAKALAPLGFALDEAALRRDRPRIAALLKPRPQDLAGVDFAPQAGADWPVSTPAEQGLDPRQVAALYRHAAHVPTLYGLLVVKNGRLVAERYFNRGALDQLSGRQSMTKSVTSALVGLALQRGCLESVDQKMLEFFPELASRVEDARKKAITIRQLLQMRSGYPWEEREPQYFETLFMRENWRWLPHIADFPLMHDPGTAYGYSNLSSHLLAVIVARACRADLRTLARDGLFAPIGAELPRWTLDPDGHAWGWGEIYLSARDMARFGQLFLDEGMHDGKRVLPAAWVRDSLRRYSEGINFTGATRSAAGLYFRDIGYGYQWWSARAGPHRFDFAWGHGGQLVVLLKALDMVVVTTADPLYERPSETGWPYESQVLDTVGRFIAALPAAPAAGAR